MATYSATKPKPLFSFSIPVIAEIYSGADWFTFNISLTNDGKPCRPKILAAIADQHPGYELICWWTVFDD